MARIARKWHRGCYIISLKEGTDGYKPFFLIRTILPYIDLMKEWCDARGVEIWSYCLMPNHVLMLSRPV
jgi:putative transposase